MVENQLAQTDHGHLGQVLTYAAGTGARTIVWIATSFREEHRQALDWLNEQTDEGTHFFGVQLSVVRIGDSIPAPLFDVVAKPNDWQKQIRSATRSGAVSERGQLYRSFWTRYLERMAAKHPDWGRRVTPQPANWMGFIGPISGTKIVPSFSAGGRLRHELYIDTGDAEANEEIFGQLVEQRASIEAAYGGPLAFEPLDGKRACRIADYRDGSRVDDEDQWPAYLDWFFDAGRRLRKALEGTRLGAG